MIGRTAAGGLLPLVFLFGTLDTHGADQVRLQLKWKHAFQFAGYYAALARGYYRDAGLNVQIIEANPGEDPEQQVIDGKADFGVGATDLLLMRDKGAPVVVLACIFQHSPLAFMAVKREGLQTVQDLVNARVMVEPDHAELYAYLKSEGVDTAKLTVLPHSYDVQDLINHKVDAMSVYVTDEPFLLRQAGSDYQLYSPRAVGIDFYSDNLFTTEAMLKKNPEMVKKFREASLRGWDYAMSHESELVDLIYNHYSKRRSVEHLQFEARQMEALLQPSVIEIGHMNPGRWRSIADVYADMGMLRRDFNLKGFLYDPNPAPPDLTWIYTTLAGATVLLIGVTLVAVRLARLSAALTRSNAELERTQVALRLKNLVFDASLAGNSVADLNGIITEANDMFLRLWGFAIRAEVIGRPFASFFHDSAEAAAMTEALGRTGQWNGEFTGRRRDGTTFRGQSLATVVRDEHGAVIGSQSAVVDISERVRTQAEKERLETQNRQLRKAESLGRMAAAIAHHFNNQLQSVMLNLEIAIDERQAGVKATANLAGAMRAIHKASEVSTLMLTYIGQAPVSVEPLDLAEICAGVLNRQRELMPPGIKWETSLAVPGTVVLANASQMERLIGNLINNACEAANNEQGVVRIAVRQTAVADIPPAHRFPPDWRPGGSAFACLEVADNGCGIADRDLENIFDPFFSSKFTGRGMGLAVVLGVVRAAGGVVTVESQPGRGSVFRVFLPITTAAPAPKPVVAAPAPPVASPAAPVRRGGGVLIVEDEMVAREAVIEGLTQAGYKVFVAADGVEALAVFRRHQGEIGCVVSDLTMPRMNGWELLARVRELAPGLPFILSSGYGEDYAMQSPHPEMPQAFLGKPYDFQTLFETIERVTSAA